MKKIKLNFKSIVQRKARWLLTIFAMLTFGIGQSYAWYYIVGDEALVGKNWWWQSEEGKMTGDPNCVTFFAKAAGTYKFKMYKYVSESDKWGGLGGSIHSAAGTAYEAHGTDTQDNNNLYITTNEVANITFKLYGTDQVDIEVTKCAYYIKYPWGGDDWVWSGDMKDNNDGTYSVMGNYGGSSFNYGRKNSDGGADYSADAQTATVVGDPAEDEYCVFTYTPSTHSLEIRKCNDIKKTNYIYFDNTNAQWSQTYMYFVIGHPYKSTASYTKMYVFSTVSNTKLMYGTVSDDWDDATYYAVAGGTSAWDGGTNWNYPTLKDWTVRSAPYLGNYNMSSGYNYIVGKENGNNDAAITLDEKGNAASALNSTQTIQYALSTNGGSNYTVMTKGNTPGDISISAYKFADGTYDAVSNTSNSSSIANNTSVAYNTSVPAAYTGETTLSATARTGYTFVGWKIGTSETTATSPVYPTAATTYTARFKAHRYSIAFNANDAQYPGTAGGSTATISNVVYDQDQTLTANGFTRAGYTFAGWATSPTGDVTYANSASVNNLSSTDGATVTLYAKWTPKPLTFSTVGNWDTESSWTDNFIPTSAHDVTISAAVTVNITDAVAKSITIDGGSLTISAGKVLEVAGTVTTAGVEDLVIETSSTAQGALIYDISTTSPYATVNVTTSNASDGYFQYIASPVGAVSVSSVFAGTGAYTYAWIEGKGWERRGYYDDFGGDEVVLISGKYGCTFSGQLNPTTGHSITCTADPENGDAQGVNMIPNTLTAPIKIAAMDLSAAYEGAVHIWNGGTGTWSHYPKATCGEAVIPALQGYAVLTATGGTVSFTYDAAVRRAATHNDALKAPKHTNSDIQDHITVSVTTNEKKVDMKLYENEQFSNDIDKGWEAVYMEGDGRYGELYAQAAKPMSILATDDLEGTVLGFAPGQAEDYTISFEGDGKGYYLNDVKKEEATLIAEGNTYTFTADESTNAKRFVISKTPIKKTPTSVENLNDGVKARKQLIDGVLYIVRDGKLYNATGTLVK